MKFILNIIFLLIVTTALYGRLTFDNNYEKDISVVKSFDISPSFLNDPILIKFKENKLKRYRSRHFFNAMDDAYLYIPMIKQLISESNVPVEFLFLAMAESNFSTKAYSHAKASGLWQFMPSTGKKYGLKINPYIDERRDLVKSTKAAISYLDALHKRFGKWYLAALAYNCGEGRVNRAIKRAKSDDLEILLNPKKKYLPRETRLYIRKILALALIWSDESFLIEGEYEYLLNRANAYSIASVSVSSGESLRRVAKILDMPYKDLRKLNSHLTYDFTPPYAKKYNIYIPYVKLADFKKNYKFTQLKNVYVVHKVKSGDNLSKLARRYHIAYKIIKEMNHLHSNILHLKQKLIIPIQKDSMYNVDSYIVRRGDTLGRIAKHYKLSIQELKKRNQLSSNMIKIGMRLKIYDY